MPQPNFDNYPSQLDAPYFVFKQKINKVLIKINVFLKWLEIIVLPVFLLFFIIFLFTQKVNCISGICETKWINLDFKLFKLVYTNSLFNFIVDFLMPFLAINGLTRIGLTFWINKKIGDFEWLFYIGLIGFALCYFYISRFYDSFAYIHAPSTKIFSESAVVEFILFGMIVSGFLVFRDKYNWDRASFFTKFRLMFYSLHLVVCVVNINFGIIMFMLSIPLMVIVDIRRQNHVHYDDPIWLKS